MPRRILNAVHDADLRSVLEGLGLYQPLLDGSLQCEHCGTAITINNLGAVIPVQARIAALCDKPQCLDRIDSSEPHCE